MKTILAMGQSNAVGRGLGGMWDIPSTVSVWNNVNDLENLASLGSAFVPANRAAAPFVNSANNIFVHAAKYLSQMLREPVRLILVAKGGLSIDKWDGKTSPMYARMKAVLSAAGVSAVDVFMWHQGEADSTTPANTSGYAAKFATLLANMEGDGIIDDETPVVIGEVSVAYDAINPVLRSLVDARTDIAPLKSLKVFDGVHFSASSLVQAGSMYANRALRLMQESVTMLIEYPEGNFVSAAGDRDVTFANGVDTKIPVSPMHGAVSWIASDGSFVAPFPGVFRFLLQGYTGRMVSRLKLLDDAGGEMRFVAYTGSADPLNNNAVLSGWCDVELSEGQKVWLGATHGSGSSTTITAVTSAQFNKLSVSVLQRIDI